MVNPAFALAQIISKIWLVKVEHSDAFITRYTMDSQTRLLQHIDQLRRQVGRVNVSRFDEHRLHRFVDRVCMHCPC